MGWQEINIKKYISEVKSNLNISISDEIIKKDIILTFILAELEKESLGGINVSVEKTNYEPLELEELKVLAKTIKMKKE